MRQSVFTYVMVLCILMTCAVTGCGKDTASDKSSNVNPAAGTFSFWMQPPWAGDTEVQCQILHCGPNTFENHIDIFQDYRYLRLLLTPNSGLEGGVGKDISDWKKDDPPHMISATWGDGVAAMYIDGVSVGAREYDGDLDISANPSCFLGSGNPKVKACPNTFRGNLVFYTRALSPDEVAALFAQPPS